MVSLTNHSFVDTAADNHSVQFFTSDAARIRSIAHFLVEGIRGGEAVLLVCSSENRELVLQAVGNRFSNEENQRIHFVDSLWAMEKVFVDGAISSDLFRIHICEKVRALVRQYGKLRVYGDVVDDLMADGQQQAVLDLEVEWHKFMTETPFLLLCGYMMENFSSFGSAEVFEEIYRLHAHIDDEFGDEENTGNMPRELSIVRAKAVQQQLATQRALMAKERLAMIGEMSKTVSQELNGPLAVVLFSADSIRDWMTAQKLPPEQVALLDAHLRRAETAALRMVSINRNMLSFARDSDSNLDAFCVQNAIRQSLDLMAVRIVCSGIEMQVDLHTDAEPLLLYGSSAGLEQVLINLVANSIDAILERRRIQQNSPYAGRISVELIRLNAHTAQLVVRDNGIGISAEHQTHMFEPFFTTKSTGSGTGLGLTFVQKTIRQHGGDVDIESMLGEGACFKCTLPVIVR